jgi:hypothetical protein
MQLYPHPSQLPSLREMRPRVNESWNLTWDPRLRPAGFGARDLKLRRNQGQISPKNGPCQQEASLLHGAAGLAT